MENKTRKEIAAEYFYKGYNCAQAVAVAFKDVIPLSEDQILHLACPFGGGYARTRNTCGAVTAIGLVHGLIAKDVATPEEKTEVYAKIGELIEQFKNLNGSIICADLLRDVKNVTKGYVPQIRNAEYYSSRPCVKFVLDAVEIIEKSI